MTRPTDPLALLAWINERYTRLDELRQKAIFEARLEGHLDQAIEISGLSRKQALALSRHENEARGRVVRWQGAGVRGA
jgi:hypothetical protein